MLQATEQADSGSKHQGITLPVTVTPGLSPQAEPSLLTLSPPHPSSNGCSAMMATGQSPGKGQAEGRVQEASQALPDAILSQENWGWGEWIPRKESPS